MMGIQISSNINKTAPQVYIGQMPGRKRLCLCVIEGSVIYTSAYFRNEEEAERFINALRQIHDMPMSEQTKDWPWQE